MINQHNLIILKKYKDSRHVYYSDTIFKRFITELGYRHSRNIDNNFKELFMPIFVTNIIIRYIYHD